MKMLATSKLWVTFSILAALVMGASTAYSQAQLTIDQFAGSYKGTAKTAMRDLSLALELKVEAGKLSGRLLEANNEHKILSGEIKENKLILYMSGPTGAERLTLEPHNGKLTGEWIIASGEWTTTGGKPGLLEFQKVVATDEISGEWDAVADAQGEAFPFTLTLKLDGEKVTGSSSSQLGTSQVSTGVWKDGRLSLVLDSSNGPIGFVATITDGKLVGDYDYLGQLQGKFVAVRKK